MSFSRIRAQNTKSVICTTETRHTHTHMLCAGSVSWETKHAHSHCITKHWRSNPHDCNTLDQQDTKTAYHRSSFPSAAPSPPPYHLRRHRLSRDEVPYFALLLACLRVARPLALGSLDLFKRMDYRVRRQSCTVGYLPRILFRAVILTTPTTVLRPPACHHGGLSPYASWAEICNFHMNSTSRPDSLLALAL